MTHPVRPSTYQCEVCGHRQTNYVDTCPSCRMWGSLVRADEAKSGRRANDLTGIIAVVSLALFVAFAVGFCLFGWVLR